MISTIITAGGASRRFGSNKLLENINGKSVIENTILKFLKYSDEIVIPTMPQTREFIENSPVFDKNKIAFANFGETRQKSVYNALLALKYKDFVLIHDGARPFVSDETIMGVIEALKTQKAVCTGVFATDTIKITDEAGLIKETIDRKHVFQAQTPQAFYYDLIKSAHEKFLNNQNFTDDSSLVEALGHKVFAFPSIGLNKKITTRLDLLD